MYLQSVEHQGQLESNVGLHVHEPDATLQHCDTATLQCTPALA
jgi:hypothetical protein